LAYLIQDLFIPSLSYLGATYHLSASELQWFLNITLLGFFLGEILIPVLFSRFNERVLYNWVWAIILGVIFIALQCKTYSTLLFMRLLIGLFGGAMTSLVRISIEKKERHIPRGYASASSMMFALYSSSAILCPLVSVFLISHYGPQGLYMFLIILLLMLRSSFIQMSNGWSITNYQYKNYIHSVMALVKSKDMVLTIFLCGATLSLIINEVVFNALFLSKQYGCSLTWFAVYVSCMGGLNSFLRFIYPMIIKTSNQMTYFMFMLLGLLCSLMCMMYTYQQPDLMVFIMGCILLSASSNILFLVMYNKIFAELCMRYPTAGTPMLGGGICASLLATGILYGWLVHYQLAGFITWVVIIFVMLVVSFISSAQRSMAHYSLAF
jgi:MFS family permease